MEDADADVHAPLVELGQVVHGEVDTARGRRVQHGRRGRRRPKPRADAAALRHAQLQGHGAPRVVPVQRNEQGQPRAAALSRGCGARVVARLQRAESRRRRNAQHLQLAQHAEPLGQRTEQAVAAQVELDQAAEVAERFDARQPIVPQADAPQRIQPPCRLAIVKWRVGGAQTLRLARPGRRVAVARGQVPSLTS